MDKPAAGQPGPEMGAVTGLPLDLPFGRHPFDWYLAALNATLGQRKTAHYLGVDLSPGAGPVGHGETPEHRR
jgi:hypothetical protein